MAKYTLTDIEKLHKAFETQKVLRVLKDGKWKNIPLEGKGIPRIAATQAKVVKLKEVMIFPEYLKKIEDATKTHKN